MPAAFLPEDETTPRSTSLDDVRIRDIRPIISPALLQYEMPVGEQVQAGITRWREASAAIVHGRDPRLLVVVGPCSIHDADEAMDYARRLQAFAPQVQDELLLVMRVYFEKPRTTVGWKGFI